MKTKICSHCKTEKPLDQFNKNKNYKDGLSYWCKDCYKVYYQTDKEGILERIKAYSRVHKDEISIKHKAYYQTHKEERNRYTDKYYQAHKEEISIKDKAYKQLHKKETNLYRRNKYKTDINFRIACILRTRIVCALKDISKPKHTMEYVGCSVDFFKQYLQSKFKAGMSWNNWGDGRNGRGMQEWHIDHIKPCASFDLSKEEQKRKYFHYTNQRPLWAKDNIEKHDKIL